MLRSSDSRSSKEINQSKITSRSSEGKNIFDPIRQASESRALDHCHEIATEEENLQRSPERLAPYGSSEFLGSEVSRLLDSGLEERWGDKPERYILQLEKQIDIWTKASPTDREERIKRINAITGKHTDADKYLGSLKWKLSMELMKHNASKILETNREPSDPSDHPQETHYPNSVQASLEKEAPPLATTPTRIESQTSEQKNSSNEGDQIEGQPSGHNKPLSPFYRFEQRRLAKTAQNPGSSDTLANRSSSPTEMTGINTSMGISSERNRSPRTEHRSDSSPVDAKTDAINRGKESEKLPPLTDAAHEDFNRRYTLLLPQARRGEIKVQAGFPGGSDRLDPYYEITFNPQTREVTISKLFSQKDTAKGEINNTKPLSPDKILENLLNIAKKEANKVPSNNIDPANFSLEKVIIDPIPTIQFDPDTKATVELFARNVRNKQVSSQQGEDLYFGLLGARVSQDIYPFLIQNLEVTKIKVGPSWDGSTYALSYCSSEDTTY